MYKSLSIIPVIVLFVWTIIEVVVDYKKNKRLLYTLGLVPLIGLFCIAPLLSKWKADDIIQIFFVVAMIIISFICTYVIFQKDKQS